MLAHHGGRRRSSCVGVDSTISFKTYIIVIVMILVLVVQFCSFLSTNVRRSKRSENKRNKRSLLRNLCRSAAFCSVSFGNSWSDCRLKFSRMILCLFLTCRSAASSFTPPPHLPPPSDPDLQFTTSRITPPELALHACTHACTRRICIFSKQNSRAPGASACC